MVRRRGRPHRSCLAGAAALVLLAGCGGSARSGDGKAADSRGAGSVTGAGCPSPTKAVAIGAPGAWQVIGRTGPEGAYRDKDVSESKLTVTNPNSVPLRVKVIVLLGSPALSGSGALVEYGQPSAGALRADGGRDYSVSPMPTVPARGSVEMAARKLTVPSPTVKAVYAFAQVLAPRTDSPCDIPVSGADPVTLIGDWSVQGCTDPAAGC